MTMCINEFTKKRVLWHVVVSMLKIRVKMKVPPPFIEKITGSYNVRFAVIFHQDAMVRVLHSIVTIFTYDFKIE